MGDPIAERLWEPIGQISVDGGTAAFGDAGAFPANEPGPPLSRVLKWPVADANASGTPLVACSTGADFELPVEVVRRAGGAITGARMCFTTDVDALDGSAGWWRDVAELPIGSGRCMAADPTCLPGSDYRLDFEVVPGTWKVQAFFTGSQPEVADCLGIRILLSGGPDDSQS